MSATERGQVIHSAAEVYEAFFLPALFQQWAEQVANQAGIQPGQRVLDVACGTGVLTRAIAERIGPTGSATGVDINEGMLAVAQRIAPAIAWKQAPAEMLPFDDNSFDAVVSQFGLMFFTDRLAALREMVRVTRPGGRLAIAVWDTLDRTPGYAAMTGLLQRLFGDKVADGLRSPFALGDRQALQRLFHNAGMPDASIETRSGTARFPSIQSWVYTDIKGWTLADMLDDNQFSILLNEAEQALQGFVADDGSVAFSAPAHIVTAVKP